MLTLFASSKDIACYSYTILSLPYFHVCISVSQLVRDIGIGVFVHLQHVNIITISNGHAALHVSASEDLLQFVSLVGTTTNCSIVCFYYSCSNTSLDWLLP